jgi:hypothetical protein
MQIPALRGYLALFGLEPEFQRMQKQPASLQFSLELRCFSDWRFSDWPVLG